MKKILNLTVAIGLFTVSILSVERSIQENSGDKNHLFSKNSIANVPVITPRPAGNGTPKPRRPLPPV